MTAEIIASRIAGMNAGSRWASGWSSQARTAPPAGEYGDPGSLAHALDGVDRVLLIAAGVSPQRLQQHQNVIDAAKAAGVGLLGFTSRSFSDRHGSGNAMMRDYSRPRSGSATAACPR